MTWSRGDLLSENYLPLHEIGFLSKEDSKTYTEIRERMVVLLFFKKNRQYSAKLYVLVQYMYNITVV